MLCARALVRALNDAKNYAQQGCAMQFDGITLMFSKITKQASKVIIIMYWHKLCFKVISQTDVCCSYYCRKLIKSQ